jgi:hypothetical protein
MRQELKGDTLAEAKPEDVTCSEFLQICKANVFLKKKTRNITTKYHHFHHKINTTNNHNKKSKTQIGYRNIIKEKEGRNRGTKEKTKKPSSNTAIAEPDHIVIFSRRAITSPPPSQPRAPPDLPLATPPSLSGVPPPLSLSLVLLALRFHLLLFYFVCFIIYSFIMDCKKEGGEI